MTVEDLLSILRYHYIPKDTHLIYGLPFISQAANHHAFATQAGSGTEWTVRFLDNVYQHVENKKALSTEQVKIILKLARAIESTLIEQKKLVPGQLDSLIAFPRYRKEPYTSDNIPREVRYLGDNMLGFRFKFNDVIRSDIKSLRPRPALFDYEPYWFHKDFKLWVVRVTRDTLQPIQNLISKHRFQFDDDVVNYLMTAENSLNQKSEFVMDPEIGIIAGQICDNELLAWWAKNVARGEML